MKILMHKPMDLKDEVERDFFPVKSMIIQNQEERNEHHLNNLAKISDADQSGTPDE